VPNFETLFAEGMIGPLRAKNRLMMAPMVRNYADERGFVTDRYRRHIERIARGGVGTLILEAAFVTPEGRGFTHQLGLHDDRVVPGLRDLAGIIHDQGALAGIQVFHAGRQTSSKVTGAAPLAPSPMPDPMMQETPRRMEQGDIDRVVQAFGRAALRAREAGLDFIELHGAHGHLIGEFLSPHTNRRTDGYGENLEGRCRFLDEVIDAVHREAGSDYPVTLRICGDEMLPGGLGPDEAAEIGRRMQARGIAALHVTADTYASYPNGHMIPPMALPDGVLLPLARRMKEAVGVPVIAVGKLRDPELAERALAGGEADFIALGRSLLADPDWPLKVREGRAINHCIACNQGCIGRLFVQQDVWCTVNPETAREGEFARPPSAPRKVLVIGGGPAGMSAAKTAAERGHRVVLCESREHLGGQLPAATRPPHRPGWGELDAYLQGELERLGVDVRLGTEGTPELARNLEAEAAIVAIGSYQTRPSLPGAMRANVVTNRDVLEGRAEVRGGVVIAGGGCSGAETAELLASEGKAVTVVEAGAAIASDMPTADRNLLLQRLTELRVPMLTDTSILDIGADSVVVQNGEGVRNLPADTVVFCLGAAPNDGVARELEQVLAEVRVVGDAREPRKVTEAIAEGALAALAIG
jgi:2,4-dienoyl-CoA reductase-like NADH-dependent reductase (Old Yellow Enzyme family)/thioredoxin reductase